MMKRNNQKCSWCLFCLCFILVGCNDVEKGLDYYRCKNYNQAFKIFHKLADQGDDEAQYYLGRMFYDGKGRRKSFKKAFFWIRKSAAQNNPKAQYILGRMYLLGEGCSKNSKLASKFLLKSAYAGYNLAQITLGKMFFINGNNKLAHEWLTKAGLTEKEILEARKDVADLMLTPDVSVAGQQQAGKVPGKTSDH